MSHRVPVALVSLALIVSGCTTFDPYTREQKVSNATKGAAIGAVAGAAAGYLSQRDDDRRDRRKGLLIGAGVGALAGGAVGNYMDRQEMALRQRLEGSGVSVTRAGDNLILNMPGNITFDVNRDEIKPNFYDVLNSVALVLKEYNKTAIEVAGHTDSSGSDSHNQQLSQRRAGSVASYLASQQVDQMRMDIVGFGESRPIANNDNEAGRQQNRRVELTLIPVTQTADSRG